MVRTQNLTIGKQANGSYQRSFIERLSEHIDARQTAEHDHKDAGRLSDRSEQRAGLVRPVSHAADESAHEERTQAVEGGGDAHESGQRT